MAAIGGARGFLSGQKRLIEARLEPIGDWTSIAATKKGTAYVWDGQNGRLLAYSCKDLSSNAEVIDYRRQVFVPTNPPVFQVRSVLCNATCRLVALSGRRGVAIFVLPTIPSTSVSQTLCKSVLLAERLLVCNHQTQVVEVKWHPASSAHNHLLVLFSDNHLRLYDVWAPRQPVQVVQLGQVPTFRLALSSTQDPSKTSRACVASLLGETAVDFDFANCRPLANGHGVWPVYVLRGNGDVYSLYLPPPQIGGSVRCEVRGPLTMYPPADDNYGVDACALICLNSEPTVLAMATGAGTIYHSVVLPRGPDDDHSMARSDWTSVTSNRMELSAPDSALYVYESVELQLSLVTDETGSDDSGVQNHYIRLHKDPTCRLRYHCSHASGVHSVALPLVSQLESFANSAEVDASSFSAAGFENQDCVVEHVICTKTFANSSPLPIVGLGVDFNPLVGGSSLFCLTSDFDLITVPLVSMYLERTPRLLSDQDSLGSGGGSRSKEPFDAYIASILKKNTSNPIIKTKFDAEPSPQEAMQLLARVTQVLRQEYINKLEIAREKIQQRVKILQRMKQQQMKEVEDLHFLSSELEGNSDKLRDTLRTLHNSQLDLTERCIASFQITEKNLPVVSDAQKSMTKEVNEIAKKLNILQRSLDQARVKFTYHLLAVDRNELPAAQFSLDSARTKSVKQILEKQGQALAALVRTLKETLDGMGL